MKSRQHFWSAYAPTFLIPPTQTLNTGRVCSSLECPSSTLCNKRHH